jgi:hypothetical protein
LIFCVAAGSRDSTAPRANSDMRNKPYLHMVQMRVGDEVGADERSSNMGRIGFGGRVRDLQAGKGAVDQSHWFAWIPRGVVRGVSL